MVVELRVRILIYFLFDKMAVQNLLKKLWHVIYAIALETIFIHILHIL